MVSMTVERVAIGTIEELERERSLRPDLRWELLDGELVVTPSPRPLHQDMAGRLYIRLMAAAPESLAVYMAPLDVHLSDTAVLQPDLVVVSRSQVTDEGIDGVPLLAVEVLSPSTRRPDLITKLELLGQAGCPHYWVVDPDSRSVRLWRLVEGRYELQARVAGDDEVQVTEPVELSFRVHDLLPPSVD